MQTIIEEYADYRLEPGFQYPDRHISISSAEQHRLHSWCDMAPEVFGDVADPSLVGRLPVIIIADTIAACRPGWGQVHTIHRITQHRPIRLGESLTLQGAIVSAVLAGGRGPSAWTSLQQLFALPIIIVFLGMLEATLH